MRVISTLKFGYPCLTLRGGGGARSILITSEDPQSMISYRLVSHPKTRRPTRYCVSTQCIPGWDMVEA